MSKKHHGNKRTHGRPHHAHPIAVAAAQRGQVPIAPPADPAGTILGWALGLSMAALIIVPLLAGHWSARGTDAGNSAANLGPVLLLILGVVALFIGLRLLLEGVFTLADRICQAYLQRMPVLLPLPASPVPERPTTRLPGTATRRLDPSDLPNAILPIPDEPRTHRLRLPRP